MATAKSKAEADTECKTANARATLLTPKSKYDHDKLSQLLRAMQQAIDPSMIDANADFFLGITHSDGEWKWDDTKSPIFSQRTFI